MAVDAFQQAHLEKARQIQNEIYRFMSPAQKLEISMQMYRSARRLKAAWIRQQNPDWTEQQIAAAVSEAFLRVALEEK